jgi:hypothetical protein
MSEESVYCIIVHLEVCRVVLPRPELKESLNNRFRHRATASSRGLDGWCCFVCGAPPFDQIYGNRYAKAVFLGDTLSLRIVIQKVRNFYLLL